MQHAMRRADKLMTESRVHELLASGYCARVGTIGVDGWPYVCPPSAKSAFFSALMAKYYGADPSRPKDFFPRLDAITLYAMSLDRIVGKETALPAAEARWPAVDKTKSPSAIPPRDA